MGDLLPQPLQRLRRRKVGVDELSPFRRGAWRDRPVGGSVVDDLAGLGDVRQVVLTEQLWIDIVHQPWRHRPRQHDPRATVISERQQLLPIPWRNEAETLRGRTKGAGSLQMQIEDGEVHEHGPLLVGHLGDRPGELLLSGLGEQGDDLPWLDVCAKADDQLGQRTDVAVHAALNPLAPASPDQHSWIQNPRRVKGRLDRTQQLDTERPDLTLVPLPVVSPDAVVMGDRPASGDDRVARRRFRSAPLRDRIG